MNVAFEALPSAESAPMPSRIDLATWDTVICHREDAYELVEGIPIMAPPESVLNRIAGSSLVGLLHPRRDGWVTATDVAVTLSEVPATVRCPDVVVLRRDVLSEPPFPLRIPIAHALLVAEVISPSSVERDLVTKRREYARAGVPAYLVVDLRDGRRELTLYSERDERGLFVEVAPADEVQLVVAGQRIPVTVADLLP